MNSNHPKSAIQNTAKAVEKRLSMLSSSEEIFNQASPPYQEALDKAGYKYTLKYTKHITKHSRKSNRRKETWFNPPSAINIKTPIGTTFMKALDSSFPDGHPLKRILNRHTVKLSYRTMPNMAALVSRHNSKLLKQLQPQTHDQAKTCSCPKDTRDKGSCPMRGQCLLNNTIYQATVTQVDSGQVQTYTGLASTD